MGKTDDGIVEGESSSGSRPGAISKITDAARLSTGGSQKVKSPLALSVHNKSMRHGGSSRGSRRLGLRRVDSLEEEANRVKAMDSQTHGVSSVWSFINLSLQIFVSLSLHIADQ